MKVTLKLTDAELKSLDTGNQKGCMVELEKQNSLWILNINDVDKFREFLNDEIDPHGFGRGNVDRITYRNLKSILSKLDKVVVLNNLQKQITKVEEIDKDFCDMIAEGCSPDESEGQFYNGVRIDEDTILVLSTYFDSMSNSEDYFHYSISKDKLVPVDAEMDEKYRELFEECNMLDYTDCFFIMGVEPIDENKFQPQMPIEAVIDYGNEYNDTIVNLDVVQNDEPKDDSEDYTGVCPECGCNDLDGGSGCDMDTQNLECSNGHEFTIQSKGWKIV